MEGNWRTHIANQTHNYGGVSPINHLCSPATYLLYSLVLLGVMGVWGLSCKAGNNLGWDANPLQGILTIDTYGQFGIYSSH